MEEERKEIEIWKDILGFFGDYQVSSLGHIKSFKKDATGIVLTPTLSHKGYERIRLSAGITKQYSVHRVVAEAFIPNPDNLPQVNHIDGNKLNNCIDNLEWCTNLENMQHARKNNLFPDVFGDNNPNARISSSDVKNIVDKYNSGISIKDLAKNYNIPISRVRSIIYGNTWKEENLKIAKRDERQNWTEEHKINSLKEKFKNGKMKTIKPIEQFLLNGESIKVYRSINQASIETGIPNSTISAHVSQIKYYNKDKTKYTTLSHAGGYIWKYKELSLEEFLNLI